VNREAAVNWVRQNIPTVLLWIVLLTMPFWMKAVGGYTELATRVVVMGLAAMALNCLLGFTGTLSFGHAAYFGIGRVRGWADDQVPGPKHCRRCDGRR